MSSRISPDSTGNGEGSSNNAGGNSGAGGRRHQQDWAQINDWELHRERITELYRDQGLHLRQVQEIMSERYGFHASQRMYKTRISKWAIDKNLKQADVAAILRMQQMRAAQGKKSKFTIRGRDIDFARVEQYLKRDPTLLKQSQKGGNDSAMNDVVPGHMEAAGITCRTPSPTPPPSPSSSAGHNHHHHHQHHPHQLHHPQHRQTHPHDQFHPHAHPHHHHHQQHDPHHGLFGSQYPMPPTTVPIVPSHAPLSMSSMVTTAASFPALSAGLSSAPFTTQQPSPMPSLAMGSAGMSYMPMHSTPTPHMTHAAAAAAAYDNHRRASLAANPPTLLSQDSTMTMAGSMPTIPVTAAPSSFHHPSFSTPTPLSATTTTMSPTYPVVNNNAPSPTRHGAFKEDLARLMSEYVHGAFQHGMWVPRSKAGISTATSPTSSYTYVSTKPTSASDNDPATPGDDSADRLAAWSHVVHETRGLLARGMIDQGFQHVHSSMDTLRQQLDSEDPALLYYLLFNSIAFGTAAATAPDPGSAADIRHLATTLCSHVQSIARIVLGEAHPVTRVFCRLFAHSDDEDQYCHSRIHSRAHLEALLVPMTVERDLLAERDPALVDGSATAQCQRMAHLLRRSDGPGRLVALDGAGDPTTPTELADVMTRLQSSRNLHTKLQFFVTYLEYLADRSGQTQRELEAQAQAQARSQAQPMRRINWNNDGPSDNDGVDGMNSTGTSVSAATYRLHSDGIPTTAAGAMQSPLSSSATSTPSSAASPGVTTMPLSSGVSSAFMPRPMGGSGGASSAASSMTTPRTMLGSSVGSVGGVVGHDGGAYRHSQLPTPQHHQQSQSPPQYGLHAHQQHQHHQQHPHHHQQQQQHQSAYPPVPSSYHHPTTTTSMATGHGASMAAQTLNGSATAAMTVGGGVNEPGSLSWELNDVVNMDWM
ncbi:hypothetical protein SBRCBS47491_007265 [Sporothrix bragantina]|uniref:Clr5 domain-containing protein n=1 Tax=Sporothrix bragantina TaxID=671064 RepID=A0ABP0CEE6_9PEZI